MMPVIQTLTPLHGVIIHLEALEIEPNSIRQTSNFQSMEFRPKKGACIGVALTFSVLRQATYWLTSQLLVRAFHKCHFKQDSKELSPRSLERLLCKTQNTSKTQNTFKTQNTSKT